MTTDNQVTGNWGQRDRRGARWCSSLWVRQRPERAGGGDRGQYCPQGYSPGHWYCWQGLMSPESGLPWAGQDKKTERDKGRVSRLGKEGGALASPWRAASKVSGWGLGSGKASTSQPLPPSSACPGPCHIQGCRVTLKGQPQGLLSICCRTRDL